MYEYDGNKMNALQTKEQPNKWMASSKFLATRPSPATEHKQI